MGDKKKLALIGLTLEGLREVAAECGMPAFAAKQMAQWLYEKRVTSIDEMTNLSLKARATLSEKYTVGREVPIAGLDPLTAQPNICLKESETAISKRYISPIVTAPHCVCHHKPDAR